jgi:hypothetical protein
MFEIEYQGSRTCLSCAYLILTEAASSSASDSAQLAAPIEDLHFIKT